MTTVPFSQFLRQAGWFIITSPAGVSSQLECLLALAAKVFQNNLSSSCSCLQKDRPHTVGQHSSIFCLFLYITCITTSAWINTMYSLVLFQLLIMKSRLDQFVSDLQGLLSINNVCFHVNLFIHAHTFSLGRTILPPLSDQLALTPLRYAHL